MERAGGSRRLSIPSTQVLEEQAQESDDLTDSEESVYSGLEDSGSDSSTEEEAEDQDSGDEGTLKGSLLSKKAQARMASQKKEQVQCRSLETESMPSAQQGLPLRGEYEDDSSDEEFAVPQRRLTGEETVPCC
ncbi:ribosome biogenesis protein BOP1 [Terrapene carolina triunguis]|uniref:ribosome biogenesis protein BOP1 n=1 Tax=Terrapene triunguis TaxID=2587831 RepID=UPI0011562A02|nr:ribosome biogenesis protein BOP1 [Terrapene carolina triunguis]